jgi:NADH-quinone oxidoreductase subunit J
MTIGAILFYLFGTLAVVSALGVILHPHPVYSALCLVLALFQIAGLFILLDAEMVAFLQVIVYAGAIMVLFLFVIMLLNLEREPAAPPIAWRLTMLGVGGLLGLELAWFFLRRATMPSASSTEPASDFGSVTSLAATLFTQHALSFELTSVLLLVAVVGAVVLAKRGTE